MSRRDKLQAMIDDVLDPLLAHDGGSVELVRYEDRVITLRLTGAYAGDPGTSYVKRGVIEPAVHEAVGPDVEVVYQL